MVTFYTKGEGLNTVLKDYQEEAIRYLWNLEGEGASSRDVWTNTNKALRGKSTISRASIINFLNRMVDEGALNYGEITGKGGHRRIYTSPYDESGFKKLIAEKIITKMLNESPEETIKVMTLKVLDKVK